MIQAMPMWHSIYVLNTGRTFIGRNKFKTEKEKQEITMFDLGQVTYPMYQKIEGI